MVAQRFFELEKKFLEHKAKRDALRYQLQDINKRIDQCMEDKSNAMKARAIIQHVAEQIQKRLEYHIGSVVSLALAAVFPDPYKFEIEFVKKRNKVECELWLNRRGERMKPVGSVGGGVLDVVSFACRVALWSLKKNRPVMILDEPFKFLHSVELQRNCSAMISELSKKLGIQFIIVTDQSDIRGDKVFVVKNGKVEIE